MADSIELSQAWLVSILMLALQVIVSETSKLCDGIGNNSIDVNCTDAYPSTSSSSDSTEGITSNPILATNQAGLSENITVILSLQTTMVTREAASDEDILRFTLIGVVILLGIMGVLVLIVIRRKSSIHYNNEKTRRQSIVRSATDQDFITRNYHPYWAAIKNIPHNTVFYTKSPSISEQGTYAEVV